MKRLLSIIILLLVLMCSCSIMNTEPPYGVWQSKDPDITMYVDPNIGDRESGSGQVYEVIYTSQDGQSKTLTVVFYKDRYFMDIAERYEENGGIKVDSYFIGNYSISDDTLTLNGPGAQTIPTTQYEEIVFTKIQDYLEEGTTQ